MAERFQETTEFAAPTDWLRGSVFGRLAPPAAASGARTVRTRVRNNFDALRLAAALLVLYGHQAVLAGSSDQTGTIGMRVLVFFSISGFLIAGSWRSDPHAGRFLMRRFLRLWPAFAVMVLVCSALAYAFGPTNLHRLAALFYLNNLYFYGFDWAFFNGRWPELNHSMWMVPYEIDLYLVFLVAACFGGRLLSAAAAAMLLYAMTTAYPQYSSGGVFEAWSPYFAGFFAAGVLLRQFQRLREGRVVIGAVVMGAVALAFGARSIGLLLVIPAAAVWIGMKSWPVLRAAARFGDLSYGIFLWSWPVQKLTQLWLPAGSSLLLQLAVVLPQVIVLAWLSWRFIERPAMRLRPAVPAPGSATTRETLLRWLAEQVPPGRRKRQEAPPKRAAAA